MTVRSDLARAADRGLTRRRFLVGTGSLAAMALIGCGSDSSSGKPAMRAAAARVDGDLNLFTWEAYVPDAVIAGFEREYGVKVKQTYFSTEEELLKKLASGLPFDMAFIASNYLTRAVEANLLRPVDRDAMEHRDEILPAFETAGYEPADDRQNAKNAQYVGVPYALGGVGMSWLTDRVGERVDDSFSALWELAAGKARRHAFLFDDPQFTIAAALAKSGKSINATSSADLDAAAEALLEIKPHLAGFGPMTITPQLVNGEGWIQMGYPGDTYQALEQVKHPERIRWQQARESGVFNNDNGVIPAAAKHPGTATVFMDWLLRPRNMRQVVEQIGYIVPTRAGVRAYNDLTADYPFLRADEQLIQNFDDWLGTLRGPALQLWQQTWTRVKAG